MTKTNDGGPAFPHLESSGALGVEVQRGQSLRDYFAAHLQIDDRLVKAVRAMDDAMLVVLAADANSYRLFARFPDAEREEWITEATPNWPSMTEVEKVIARLELEARAMARVRWMQADAMLAERERAGGEG